MTSGRVKKMFALLAALAVGLGFAATTSAAPPAGLQWEVHGTGNGPMSLAGGSSSGPAMPQYIGNATYFLDFNVPAPTASNGATGFCEFITGDGTIEAADGSRIFFNTVGTLCNEATAASFLHYNGTYRITNGDGRFIGVAGGGSLTLTAPTNPLGGSPHFFKIDGTITGI